MASERRGWAALLLTVPLVLVPGLVLVVLGLVWAWRDTEPAWLMPTLTLGGLGAWLVWAWFARSVAAAILRLPVVPRLLVLALPLLPLLAFVGLDRGTAEPGPGKRVAVVGAGAAGMHSAWLLARTGADVTVYEAAPYVGGHAYAYPFQADDGSTCRIDLGFMFGSPTSYTEMKALLALKGVGRNPATLGMAANVDGELWATGMADLDPEVERFQNLADASWDDPSLTLVPFGAWLWWHGFDEAFQRKYLTPLMSVLFITDRGLYRISTRFMMNMIAGPKQWVDFRRDAQAWTVRGSSGAYYDALVQDLGASVRLLTPVRAVTRLPGGKVRVTAQGPAGPEEAVYDAVVFGVHADVARKLLTDASWLEDWALGQIRYENAEVVVHTDASSFPTGDLKRSYIYVQDKATGDDHFELHSLPVLSQGDGVTVVPEPVITLNPAREYAGERSRRTWRHHPMDMWHLVMATQVMPHLQGNGNVWYAGDWVKFIGHGQAIRTGLFAACGVGGKVPEPGLSTEPCFDVAIEDAVPSKGAAEKTLHLCGEKDVFDLLVAQACTPGVMP